MVCKIGPVFAVKFCPQARQKDVLCGVVNEYLLINRDCQTRQGGCEGGTIFE